MYNPFKPHIIQRGAKFVVRRFIPFGTLYMDGKSDFWWLSQSEYFEDCLFDSAEEAKQSYESRYKTKFIQSL